jgi:enoyl-CoA hydratase/carnithine racemase
MLRAASSLAASCERVSVSRAPNGVATVTLSRGKKMNALDMPMFRAIRRVARDLCDEPGLRAVVLCGEGRAFCAGLDVGAVAMTPDAVANMEELLHRPAGEAANLAQAVGYLRRRLATLLL